MSPKSKRKKLSDSTESKDAGSTLLPAPLKPAGVDWRQHKQKVKNFKEGNLLKKLENQAEVAKATSDSENVKVTKTEAPTVEVESTSEAKGRHYTISIALPGAILDNAQSPELQTYLVGQIARAAAVFNVDEIVVFDETGSSTRSRENNPEDEYFSIGRSCIQMARILQYLECPQYLRKMFFPLHRDLEYAGLLNPLDTVHHMRATELVHQYREGVVTTQPLKNGKGSLINAGLTKSVKVDKCLEPGVRVTVKIDTSIPVKKHYIGEIVSPSTPRTHDGLYWGYTVRVAGSLGRVFTECPFREGYDVTIGTSERGKDVDGFQLCSFKHLLIVFGGLKGLEASLDADEGLTVTKPDYLFNHYLNTCPNQGSRTIRTEEAILITLATLRPKVAEAFR